MKYKILIICIIILGIFIRLYRFPELVNFSLEQTLALDTAGDMVKTGKITLVGIEYFIRQTSAGHSFFNSAFYLYPISLTQLIFGFDPITSTLVFTLLNLLSGIGIFFLAKKLNGDRAGLVSATLFMFSSTMVNISRTVWHVYLLIPITVLVIWTAIKIKENLKPIYVLILGFFLGLGFGIHISYTVPLALFSLFLIKYLYHKKKLSYLFLFVLGLGLGNLPAIVFDLRHNFYNLTTTITFLYEGLVRRESGFSFESYHFLYLLVPIYIWGAKILVKLFNMKTLVLILILYLALSAPKWNLTSKYPTGMTLGTNLNTLKQIAEIISTDTQSEFEVASITDGQTRAENIRYILKFLKNKPSMGYDKYPDADVLYVISFTDQNPLDKSVWEINSIKPAGITKEWKINNLVKLSKIQRI